MAGVAVTWAEVVARQREFARVITAQPLTPEGLAVAVARSNDAMREMRAFDSPVDNEEWRTVYALHRNAQIKWFARYRAMERMQQLEQLRADHVALCTRATARTA